MRTTWNARFNAEPTNRYGGLLWTLILLGLVVLHFLLRPSLGDGRIAPDFLLLALMLYSIRTRPGRGAIAGFCVGIIGDALAPVAFGASALAHTVVGYLQAWGKAVFFPDNLLVSAGFLFVGTMVRNSLVLLAGGQVHGMSLVWAIGVWSIAQAFTTTLVGILLIVAFRRLFEEGLRG
ncbi:MAG: rod shape-determining protein MreD [Gemmatimonadota bacterium]|nr:rod shape-determining protein MreD [Gemmatimonadota bacterium]MDH5804184.1 rod shape-determining protein MreD [Gemmatimonadota bacterium]